MPKTPERIDSTDNPDSLDLPSRLANLERQLEIEISLEKVRARSIGMRKSEDVLDVTGKMFDELQTLGLPLLRCGIGIVHDINNGEAWATSFTPEGSVVQVTGHVDFTEKPEYQALYAAWEKQIEWFKFELSGEGLLSFLKLVYTELEIAQFSDSFPEKQVINYFGFEQGGLFAVAARDLEEQEGTVLKKFAQSFHLTYTRYQDLIKIEERARLAQRKAALNRIQAVVAGMRTSHDIEYIPPVLWTEIKNLGLPFLRCGIFIFEEDKEAIDIYLTSPEGERLAQFSIPIADADFAQKALTQWKKREPYQETWNRERFNEWISKLKEQGLIDDVAGYLGHKEVPEKLTLQFVPFGQGMLYIGSEESMTDVHFDLVQEMASVFHVAYTRYEDFVALEAAKSEAESALDELQMAQSRLVHAEKVASLGQLAAGIAYEIKTPINFVNNFAELNNELTEELEEALSKKRELYAEFGEVLDRMKGNAEAIIRHGNRASDIVTKMEEHAMVEKNSDKEIVDFNELVTESVSIARNNRMTMGLTGELEIDLDLEEGLGDVSLIRQDIQRVILNLMSNSFQSLALKARQSLGPDMARIEISTHSKGKDALLRVSDNGLGIPESIKNKIFDPFFTTKPIGKGSGLGLSLSYELVTLGHGGKLVLEESEEGARFLITIPR